MNSASELSHNPSIAIVGGGIIGLSAAWRLAQSGWRVTVYDRAEVGKEASWAGAGMLSPGGEIDALSPLATLALESCQLYAAFVGELQQASGVEIDYQQCGALELAYSATELAALDEKAARQVSIGIASKPVPLPKVLQFWPRIRHAGLAGARFYSGDAIVNPRQVVQALSVAGAKLGASLKTNCPITAIELTGDGIWVHHPPGSDRFDAAIVAAGAWSNSINVHNAPSLPSVEPLKGHLIGYAQPDQTCSTILRYGHTYLLQRANGLLIAGASVEHVGFDRSLKHDIIQGLVQKAGFVLPHLAETTPSEAWVGFRPASDSLRLGSWHSCRLYLAYGHYRNGILLAPVTAQRLVSEINANFGKR